MATLTVQEYDRDGLHPDYATCSAGGDTFANNGDTIIHVKNAQGAATATVTIKTQATVDGLAVADKAVTLPATEDAIIGPFPPSIYNTTGGMVELTYDTVVTVTVAAIQKA